MAFLHCQTEKNSVTHHQFASQGLNTQWVGSFLKAACVGPRMHSTRNLSGMTTRQYCFWNEIQFAPKIPTDFLCHKIAFNKHNVCSMSPTSVMMWITHNT